jgi:uncharacterized protein YjbI with pentapeptide repeats
MKSNDTAEVQAYPGLGFFEDTENDRRRFYGRPKEIQALLDLVLSCPLTLLFSRSGLGKTSLINAGLCPELRDRRLLPVTVRPTYDPVGGPVQSIMRRIREEVQKWGMTISGPERPESLWSFLYETTISDEARRVRPILIVDQFEELFTVIRHNPICGPEWERSFIKELADLVRRRVPEEVRQQKLEVAQALEVKDETRKQIMSLLYEGAVPDVKVVLAMREDFLPELEALQTQLPGVFQNALRLQPLTIEQAHDAIVCPAERADLLGKDTFSYEPEAVREMLDYLSSARVFGGRVQGNTIEPVLLQVLCHHIDHKRRLQQSHLVTTKDLGGARGMKRVTEGYYRNIIRQFPRLALGWNGRRFNPSWTNLLLLHRPRAAARTLCERGLITPDGYRNSLARGVVTKRYGVRDRELEGLTRPRLVRSEPRLGTQFIELMHDTLVEPLRGAGKRRRLQVLAVAALFPLWLAFGVTVYHGGAYLVNRLQVFQLSHAAPERQLGLFLDLIRNGHRDFRGARINGVEATRRYLLNCDFSGAEITRATLTEDNFLRCSFQGARLADVDLSGSDLSYAHFKDATLSRIKLGNADLTGAVFSNASLEDVDLSNSNLTGTDFDRAVIGDIIRDIKVTGTPWWLAAGWSGAQVAALNTVWSPSDFEGTERYQWRVDTLRARALEASDSADSVRIGYAWNSLAWFRVTNSNALDSALTEVNRALDADSVNTFALDTRGYIRLRQGAYDAVIRDIARSIELKSDEDGERSYHLGLAYQRVSQDTSAQRMFSQAHQLGYKPTYELLFTPESERAQLEQETGSAR